MQGLESEVNELRQVMFDNEIAFKELIKSYTSLEKLAAKESKELNAKIEQHKAQILKLQDESKKFLKPRVFKPYHELAESQRTKEHRRIRDHVNNELEPHLKKRKLTVNKIVLEDEEGKHQNITINAHPPRTYPNLTEAEKEVVSRVSDKKVINRQSDAGYAALRSVSQALPPLTHIKQYEAELRLPEIEVAPGRSGGFCSLEEDSKTQLEHLAKVNDLTPEDEVTIKIGIDGTRLVKGMSACLYSATVITSKGSSIGVIGAIAGGDAWEDMQLCGKPFFNQVFNLAKNPKICTSAGVFNVKIRVGGDMCNILELFGLAKASSSHPCFYCVLNKSQFYLIPSHPELREACNHGPLVRTRGGIIEEAKKSVRNFSVKNFPLSPLPLDLNRPLLLEVLLCSLHYIMRAVGKEKEKAYMEAEQEGEEEMEEVICRKGMKSLSMGRYSICPSVRTYAVCTPQG